MVDQPVSAAAREAAAAKVRARQQLTDNLPPPFGTRLETNSIPEGLGERRGLAVGALLAHFLRDKTWVGDDGKVIYCLSRHLI